MVLESRPPENKITAGASGLRGAKCEKAADNEDITDAYLVAASSRCASFAVSVPGY
jgi:hypothetical protein